MFWGFQCLSHPELETGVTKTQWKLRKLVLKKMSLLLISFSSLLSSVLVLRISSPKWSGILFSFSRIDVRKLNWYPCVNVDDKPKSSSWHPNKIRVDPSHSSEAASYQRTHPFLRLSAAGLRLCGLRFWVLPTLVFSLAIPKIKLIAAVTFFLILFRRAK